MEFKFLENRKKNKAIKKYIRRLPAYLEKEYGKKRFYSEKQISTILDKYNIRSKYDSYAYSMCMTEKEANGVLTKLSESRSAKELNKFMIISLMNYNLSSSRLDFDSGVSYFSGDSDGGGDGGD